MKVAVIATHSWPIRLHTGTPAHTGDRVIVDLVWALEQLGHEVTFVAPEGSYSPPNGRLLPMPCSFGQYPPSADSCELEALNWHKDILLEQDIVHDWSASKRITEWMVENGHRNVIRTMLGGVWTHPTDGLNVVCQSRAMLERGLRGATDYEGSPTPDLAGPPMRPLRGGRFVYDGIDTDFWCPSDHSDAPRGDYYLWLQRWHPVRGFKLAIELARKTGIRVIMAGTDPREDHPTQAVYCREAQELAKGASNIEFRFLPRDDYEHQIAIRELYRNARTVLYPTQFAEPFGLGQVEALACGTPVIGTDYGSVPEVLIDGLTGIVCENSVDAFAAALEPARELSRRACRIGAIARFDRRVMACNYVELYREVLDGRGWGGCASQ